MAPKIDERSFLTKGKRWPHRKFECPHSKQRRSQVATGWLGGWVLVGVLQLRDARGEHEREEPDEKVAILAQHLVRVATRLQKPAPTNNQPTQNQERKRPQDIAVDFEQPWTL